MRKRNITIGLLAVASLILITTGVTLAFFNYAKQGETENVLRTGSIKFHYDETSKMGNGIKIEDALPVDSNESEKTNNHYFAFNITGKSSSQDISYVVTARKSNDSDNIDSDIDLYLTDDNNQVLFDGIHKYSDLVQYRKINNYTEKVIYTDTVEGNGVEVSKNFRLRMWIDEKTDFSNGAYNNKTFKITVNVYTDTNIDGYEVAVAIPNAGLYDANDNLLADWDTLVNTYGLDIEKDYVYEDFDIDSGYIYIPKLSSHFQYIITHNPSLATGKKLVATDITKIGDYAFIDSDIEIIYIPKKVTSIGNAAFTRSSLDEINIESESALSYIGYNAFGSCYSLNTITIPKMVTSIKSSTFSLAGIESINFESGSHLETIEPGSFDTVYNLTGIVIPASVKTIGNNAFAMSNLNFGTKLASVTFEEGSQLETISPAAFANSKELKSIEIPANVTTIGPSAFVGSGLETITFAPNSKIETLVSSSLNVGEALKTVILPASLKAINANAFYSDTNLANVTFSDVNGWSAGGNLISASDLSDTSVAATYLKSTYIGSNWTKSN